MTTIEEFIGARLAEDESVAHAATRSASSADWHYGSAEYAQPEQGWVHNAVGVVLTFEREGEGAVAEPVGTHIARHDPARVLRQVAALRAVVGRQAGEHRNNRGICETCRDYDFHREYNPVPWPCPTARAVAGIWSDHPDYRQEWAA